ncbi:hypothetical protein HPB47_001250 [Ixodes persulcatus]|uniref:Uncharacterized protein n=1 Tax=Ixodes persulcatus TaxID=34615 RepID=A0AC60PRG1_IXOPE|nr:hypothetical protein HPB47_001250 [Ixodes persulcatus]
MVSDEEGEPDRGKKGARFSSGCLGVLIRPVPTEQRSRTALVQSDVPSAKPSPVLRSRARHSILTTRNKDDRLAGHSEQEEGGDGAERPETNASSLCPRCDNDERRTNGEKGEAARCPADGCLVRPPP